MAKKKFPHSLKTASKIRSGKPNGKSITRISLSLHRAQLQDKQKLSRIPLDIPLREASQVPCETHLHHQFLKMKNPL